MTLRTVLSLAICLIAVSVAQAHETAETIPVPGFRPESALETRFLEDVGSATIAVYPTMVRRADRTAHSFPSRQQVVTFLNERGIGRAFSANRRIDRGGMHPDSQWNMFQASLQIVGEAVAASDVEADYVLVLEILVPGDEAVFGIECYIVDRQGENAFSFLLNSHHRMFAEAGLVVADSSQAARDALTRKATDLAMEALAAQTDTARASAAQVPAP